MSPISGMAQENGSMAHTQTTSSSKRAAIDTIGLTVMLSEPSWLQPSLWAGPYQAAIEALLAGNYHLAIAFLKQAIEADPRAEARKLIGRVYRIDYNPYYYLGVAYLELGRHDMARRYLDEARPNLPAALRSNFDRYEQRLLREQPAA